MTDCRRCGKSFHDPHHRTRVYCSRTCWSATRKLGFEMACEACGKLFYVQRFDAPGRRCCSRDCAALLKTRPERRGERVCLQCGNPLVASQRAYCSRSCMGRRYADAFRGESNPNHGLRHPGAWQMSGEQRAKLSRERVKRPDSKYRHQKCVKNWALANLGDSCSRCQKSPVEVHHIAPTRRFPSPVMAHFRQNLVLLCTMCHAHVDREIRSAIKQRSRTVYPFGYLLPESILAQLVQDGSVSSLSRECDFAPLGNVAEQVVHPEWFDDTAGLLVESALGA